MSAPTDLRVDGGELLATGCRPGCLADSLGERHKVVYGTWRRIEFPVVPDKLPATGRGQTACMLLAQVVGVRLGRRGERPYDGGRVRVHVRQRRDCQTWAAVARATPW